MHKYVRNTDPLESWLAAQKIDAEKINKNKKAVLTYIQAKGTSTQQEAEQYCAQYHDMTPQRTRTTFHDLETDGIINKTGENRLTNRGRKAAVYALNNYHTTQKGLFD